MCYLPVSGCCPLSIRMLSFVSSASIVSSPEAQQVGDDKAKPLPALGEQQNSNNDINESVFIWGIADKAASRKSISVWRFVSAEVQITAEVKATE